MAKKYRYKYTPQNPKLKTQKLKTIQKRCATKGGQTVRKLQNKERSKIKKSKMIQNEDMISKVNQHSAKSKIKN